MMNYQGLYGSEAPEVLDVAVCLRVGKLEHVGVGYSEAFCLSARIFYSELGEGVCEVPRIRCRGSVTE